MEIKTRVVNKDYYALAYGHKKPHSKDCEIISAKAKLVIRFLVEDWI